MRIISGSLKGRHIRIPRQAKVRPTSERTREAIFSTLESLGVIAGREVLDLYAGSGALGIEALSRGGKNAVFVERDKTLSAVLKENLQDLMLSHVTEVVTQTTQAFLKRGEKAESAQTFGLIFADPPYQDADLAILIGGLTASKMARPGSILAAETAAATQIPAFSKAGNLVATLVKEKKYGDTAVRYFEFIECD